MRVYVGHLSLSTTARDLEDVFKKYGVIMRCDMKNGFAFLEFEDDRDADDAVRAMNGRELDGNRIIVEEARGPRPGGPRGGGGGGASQRTNHRVRVEGITSDTSWQDLKDFARCNGRLIPIYTEVQGRVGVVEYRTLDDMKDAMRLLHDTELRGAHVKLYEDRPGRSRSRSRSHDRRPPPSYSSRDYDRRDGYDRSPPRYQSHQDSPGRGYRGGRGRSRSR